jgi:hypothetical protein
MLLCGILVAGVSGCATRGGGETWPISVNGQKVLVNSASVLSMETSQSCNAQAQVEYNLNIAVCEGKLTPVFPIQLAGVNAQAQLLCQAFGYTNSSEQLAVPESIELGNCSATAMPVTPHIS